MIWVLIYGSYHILGDNDSMIKKLSIPYTKLKNKQNSIVYHRFVEAVATAVINMEHIPVKSNPYVLLAKPLGSQQQEPLIK